jgi:hypothetical protein
MIQTEALAGFGMAHRGDIAAARAHAAGTVPA